MSPNTTPSAPTSAAIQTGLVEAWTLIRKYQRGDEASRMSQNGETPELDRHELVSNRPTSMPISSLPWTPPARFPKTRRELIDGSGG